MSLTVSARSPACQIPSRTRGRPFIPPGPSPSVLPENRHVCVQGKPRTRHVLLLALSFLKTRNRGFGVFHRSCMILKCNILKNRIKKLVVKPGTQKSSAMF